MTTSTRKAAASAAVAALTPKERADLLKELDAPAPELAIQERKLTPRERVIAVLLRERDHLDGCPVYGEDGKVVAASTEATEATVGQPSREAAALNLGRGDTMTVVRCHRCGGTRYKAGTIASVIRAELQGLDTDEDPDGSL